MPDRQTIHSLLTSEIATCEHDLVSIVQELVKSPSPNLPGDTTLVVEAAERLIAQIPGARVTKFETAPGIVNLVACVSSRRPGKRLVFSGHLDTYPICEHLNWTVPPLGGIVKDGCLYGRGASDMKGGIAASIIAADVLANNRDMWTGEVVIALAGDEENMGQLGLQWLLDNVEAVKNADVMVCGDVGSPNVIRFGEKGLCWFEITAIGIAAHGAHVHRGTNAIDRLRKALDVVQLLENTKVRAPDSISEAIATASEMSESTSGKGETETLQRVTVNIGYINGGALRNLVPSHATSEGDIRLPAGTSVAQIKQHFAQHLGSMEGVRWRFIQAYEPSYTNPSSSLVQAAISASALVMGQQAVANVRVGASDTRLFRPVGIPSVVIGLTPYGMGREDKHIVISELCKVAQIHALVAYELLKN